MFQSFFQGGFECSTHRTRLGRRLDLIAATRHDVHAAADYRRARAHDLRTVRDGIRWHLIERSPGRFDFSSVVPMVRAAREAGVQVIWDLCHYGWPDDLDLFSPRFIDRFARLARAFATLLTDETDAQAWIAPINEPSFFSWACGEVALFSPFERGRGEAVKRQLVRAAIAGIEAVWEVLPSARIVHTDPLIHVVAHPTRPHERWAAEEYRDAQFHARDMIGGLRAPELGGHPRYLDVLGVNFYPENEWTFESLWCPRQVLDPAHPLYRPLRDLLGEVYARYGRPLFVSETGTEGESRTSWLRFVAREVRAAIRAGVPVGGICLYPVTDYPGWEVERPCATGLWGDADEAGERPLHLTLARELHDQIRLMEQVPGPRDRDLGRVLAPEPEI